MIIKSLHSIFKKSSEEKEWRKLLKQTLEERKKNDFNTLVRPFNLNNKNFIELYKDFCNAFGKDPKDAGRMKDSIGSISKLQYLLDSGLDICSGVLAKNHQWEEQYALIENYEDVSLFLNELKKAIYNYLYHDEIKRWLSYKNLN